MKYFALLRGINVGGNKKVSMEELKDYFTDEGFTNITTILNTGNIVFDAQKGLKSIQKQVDELLEKNYDFSIPSVVYSEEELVHFMGHISIQRIVESVEKGE